MKPDKELARVCAMVGSEVPLWTQSNGGNVSVKVADRLWIKASGYRLDAVTESLGVARLSIPYLVEGMQTLESKENGAPSSDEAYFGLVKQSAEREGSSFQPSMESGFHAALTQRWVMHLHSLAAIILARPEHTEYISDLSKKLGEKITTIPEIAPGLELSTALAKNPESRIYLLANHGVILQQDDAPAMDKGVLAVWREVERRVRPLLRPASSCTNCCSGIAQSISPDYWARFPRHPGGFTFPMPWFFRSGWKLS